MTPAPLTREQQALVVQWRGLAVSVTIQAFGHADPDAVSEGYVGLCHAARKFRTDMGAKFPTYAMFWVRAFVLKEWLRNSTGDLKIGTNNSERRVMFNLGRAQRFLERCGMETTAEAVGKHLGVPGTVVESVRERLRGAIQYQHTREDGEFELPDHSHNPEEMTADDQYDARGRRQLRECLGNLDERERFIIRRRWMCDRQETLAEVGRRLGVSRERVRQLEEVAIRKLKAWMRSAA